jgi:hypothetical protein
MDTATATRSIVLVHGAGSTGAAAADLLGLTELGSVSALDDRTGDVDSVIASLDEAVADAAPGALVMGVSLGAHAVARWAAASRLGEGTQVAAAVCLLPAWTGAPGATAAATAAASRDIARHGIAATCERLERETTHPDVLRLLRLAWSDYSDSQLARSLATASQGDGPTPGQLRAMGIRTIIAGWHHDALHPAAVALDWARQVPGSQIAMAARPDAALLQSALATVLGSTPVPGWHLPGAESSRVPHPGA